MPRLRRLAVVVMLVVTGTAGMLVGLAPPAFAGTFPSTSLSWSASSTGTGVTGVGYTYFFTPASSSPVKTVTMTVPAGTAGTPAVGTVTPSTLTGDSVALAGTTLTFTSTAAPTLSSSTPVSIQITGLTNTSTSGSYTSTVTTNNASGTLVDSGTTPVPGVSITGARVPAPAGQWQFGEGSGTNAYDSSGNGHTGTVGSGATWAAPEVGKYSLATSGTLTAAVTIPGPVVNTAASYTVSAWVYLNNVNGWQSNYQTFVSITGLATPLSNTVDGFYLQYRGNTHDWGFDVYPSDSNTGNPTIVVAQSTAAALPNTWYHLVGVYNSVAQTLSLYVNGVLQGTPTSYTSSWQATGNTMIGQGYFSGTTNYVNGGTDDVALYSSALTTPQVDALNQPTISSGYSHTCEITNGNAYCWGLNASGELGDNSTVSSTVPVPVLTGGTSAIPTGTILTQISAGDNSTCALSSAGAAYCWGGDSSDQLGTNTSITGSLVPLAVSGGYVFTQIDEGNGTTCALTSAGAAYCWGANASGQLGPGGTCPCSNSNTPVLVSAPLSGAVTWAQISAGGTTGTNGGFVCAVTTTGLAYCWGGNDWTNSGATAVDDQLGNTAANNPQTTPLAVTTSGTALSGVTVTQVTTGSNFACALGNTGAGTVGAAYCWGNNTYDQIGNAAAANPQPTALAVTVGGSSAILSTTTLTQIGAGNFFVCALGTTSAGATGTAYCWGHATDGALGNNNATGSTSTAVAVSTSGVLTVGGVVTPLTQVDPGGAPFVCALDTFGTAYCWGTNSNGQAGNPDTMAVGFPVPATVTLSQPTTIAAGTIHSCEIDGGLAYCWGDNSNGEFGDNGTMTSSAPVAVWTGGVLSGVTLTEITNGTNFSCALSSAGAAYCWGLGTSGQLGNNLGTTSYVPVAVSQGAMPAGTALTQITAGYESVCALASTGAAYCWGLGTSGQLGNSTTACPCASSNAPVAVATSGVLSGLILTGISTGGSTAGTSTCALASTGAAYCWGFGTSGQLGNSGFVSSNAPVVVTATPPGVLAGVTLTAITTGSNFACALASTGVAFCWGDDTYGELGNSITTSTPTYDTPVAVTVGGTSAIPSGTTLTQLSAGSNPAGPNSVCALASTGAAYCWGGGASGQLGYGSTTTAQNTAVAVTASGVLLAQNLTQITVGTTYACAQGNTSADSCWGENSNGQDGNPDTAPNFLLPVAVASPPTTIAAGGRETSCTIYIGKAYCWGDDSTGELGNGVTGSATGAPSTPVAVYTGGVLAGVVLTQITMGWWYVCALASTGAVYCWGDDTYGQLGNGTTSSTPSNVPVLVSGSGPGGLTFTQISAGQYSMCGVTSGGAVYCWGQGTNGQLGVSGSVASSNTPVPATGVLAGPTIVQVAVGYFQSCALSSAGAAYCWGTDTYGEVGTTASATSTVQPAAAAVIATGVLLNRTIVQIAAGGQHTCALDSTGLAYCWGYNTNGQLGSTATPTATNPVPVAVIATGALVGVTLAGISATEFDTCALGSAGVGFCWGYNQDGRLGVNSSGNQFDVPTAVYVGGVLAGRTLTQIDAGDQDGCALDSTNTAYCWGNNANGQEGNDSTTEVNAAVLVDPQAPTNVTATPGDTTATVSWTAPVYLNNGTLKAANAYAVSSTPGTATCSTAAGTTTCGLTGLTDGTLYSVTVIDTTTTNNTITTTGTSAPSSPAVTVEPISFSLISPTSLTWTLAGTGANQSIVDGHAADEQFTVSDPGTAGWNISVSATTFTAGTHTLPNTSGTFNFNGSLSSSGVSPFPTTICVATCTGTAAASTTSYPVNIITAASPALYEVYSTPNTTGEGVWTIGVSTDANPIGWWVQVPANSYAGTYTSTVTLELSSGP